MPKALYWIRQRATRPLAPRRRLSAPQAHFPLCTSPQTLSHHRVCYRTRRRLYLPETDPRVG